MMQDDQFGITDVKRLRTKFKRIMFKVDKKLRLKIADVSSIKKENENWVT